MADLFKEGFYGSITENYYNLTSQWAIDLEEELVNALKDFTKHGWEYIFLNASWKDKSRLEKKAIMGGGVDTMAKYIEENPRELSKLNRYPYLKKAVVNQLEWDDDLQDTLIRLEEFGLL